MDFFGKDARNLKQKRLFLFDMDGTIYNEDKLFDGTKDLLAYIKENHAKAIFITNNSSRSVTDYVSKLDRLGIISTKEDFFTSSMATVLYLKEKFPNQLIYCQGTQSLLKELETANLKITTEVEEEVSAVVVGFDTELTSEKLRKTSELLTKGIPFIATNPDLACPVSFGYIPDCGSICQMLTNATAQTPTYIGKPNATMIELVMSKWNCTKEETVVIGDRLYTDIASGNNAGVTSICVLTGEATIQDITEGNIKPTFTFKSVKEILEELKSNR